MDESKLKNRSQSAPHLVDGEHGTVDEKDPHARIC